jgi:hypothetical protein
MDARQLKKDWLTMLVSTGGIMLTLCLTVLTILYTSSSTALNSLQLQILTLGILATSILLAGCVVQSLDALGALILAAVHDDGTATSKDVVAKAESRSAANARSAQSLFRTGVFALMLTIGLAVAFLNGLL